MKKVELVIEKEQGLHARPASQVVSASKGFLASITIKKGDKEADAKRLLAIMSLNVLKGDKIAVVAEGEDEDQAIKVLEELLLAH